ncbi:pyridoxal phosphate-dependent decarboxylase family protein [Anaerosporobacter faecicola]|uniref:pyridoxal phosphate-dependent decarboxylase family protein n=1 Tax=Anaerosporobacter faecicola TaxID=2718714 RepID=UPI001A9BDE0F|nr:aminotransferase class V-fold PLP-dependent enzyme [Anaerosporobacter faecicola]
MRIEQMKLEQRDGELLDQVVSYAKDYLKELEKLQVYPDEKSLNQLEVFDEELQAEGTKAQTVLEMLQNYGKDATVNHGGGKYFGFVMGGNLPVSQYARVLADIWDQNAGLYLSSPIAGKLEEVCERWLVSLLGLPEHTAASFVSGSSMANFYALLTARNEVLRRQGYDVVQQGLYHTKPIRVVLGEEAHSSIIKALVLAGFGKESMEFVPVDDQGRMRADQVPELDENTVLILQAGHVNTGAFDPFDELCDKARKAGAWIHIDGAFGLWAATSKTRKNLTKGIEKADSWTVDAHKTLNIPYDSGIAFCRNRESLVRTMQASGSYIQFSEHRDGMLYGVEMSRRARGIELWAALKYLGRDGVAKLIDTLCEQASYLANRLKAMGLLVENEVVYNQVIVRRETEEETQQLLKAIQDSCEIWCGGAIHQGRKVIRFSVCSWQMTREALDQSVACISKLL